MLGGGRWGWWWWWQTTYHPRKRARMLDFEGGGRWRRWQKTYHPRKRACMLDFKGGGRWRGGRQHTTLENEHICSISRVEGGGGMHCGRVVVEEGMTEVTTSSRPFVPAESF